MDISVRSEGPWLAEDRSWLASDHGTTATRSITLNVASFTAGTHFPNGFIPSGTVLGRITATGLYGPYDNAANDGREVAAGFLFNSTQVRVGGANVGAPLLEHGFIRESRLPAASGLDAAGRTDLGAKFTLRP